MPRHYSPEEKQQILDRLLANRGDATRTAAEFGIHPATLYKWRKATNFANSLSSFSSPISPITDPPAPAASPPLYEVGRGSGGGDVLPPDDLQALRDLKAQMLDLARYIINNDQIKQAIDAAPLKERIAALSQLIDRMIKLGTQLPANEEEVEIINYERGETDEEDTTNGETAWETTDYFG